MAREAHPNTLFHLLPNNQLAHDALFHADNKQHVSSSNYGPGFEVGYHVPSIPRGHVITRLGRDADLILRKSTPEHPISGVHVAFEINPTTYHVLLSVRSKRISSVTFTVLEDPSIIGENIIEENNTGEKIIGDGVILYGQNYRISIASYQFRLIWRTISETDNALALKALAVQGYETSLQQLQHVRSRDRPTEIDNSEAQSWHITRLNTTKGPIFQDVKQLRRRIGFGAFGTVYEAVDRTSGYKFAIKVVNLSGSQDVEAARAILHREIKVMQRVKHKNIIEYLGHQLFQTLQPEIFMPLRSGSLISLTQSPPPDIEYDELCFRVLGQMLSALDYLASENLIHRDVKPDNILYYLSEGRHLFQLADFGLAHHHSLARTNCGTGYYQAPELWPFISGVVAGQSPKLDIWSLYACIVAIRSKMKAFPPTTGDYGVILQALQAGVPTKLQPMARLHPDRRASAAQMLVFLFNGEGLTTPQSKIPPIEPDAPPPKPITRLQTRNDRGKAAPQRATASPLPRPLVVLPPQTRARTRTQASPGKVTGNFITRLPPPVPNRGGKLAVDQFRPIRAYAPKDRVVKCQAESRGPTRTSKANTFTRTSPEQSPPAPSGPPSLQEPVVLKESLYHIPGAFVD